jgi:hypothetical protein
VKQRAENLDGAQKQAKGPTAETINTKTESRFPKKKKNKKNASWKGTKLDDRVLIEYVSTYLTVVICRHVMIGKQNKDQN